MEDSAILVKSKMSQETDMGEEPGPVEPQSKRLKSESGSASESQFTSPCKDGVAAVHGEDDYEHVQSGLVYVVTSFPGASIPHTSYGDYIQGCKCGKICFESCQCFLQQGFPYKEGKLKETYYKKPVFECNDWCDCSDDCPSRVMQRGPVTGLKILQLSGKGHGVVSSCFIPKNSFVCEYAGEYISVEEARIRFSQQSNEDSNYILVLKEHFLKTTAGPCFTIIDPTVVGNIGRYINHSCNPNLVVVPVCINSMFPHAALFAIQDILPGEELCYDYSSTVIVKEEFPVPVNERKVAGSADDENQKVAAGNNSMKKSTSSLVDDDEVLQSKTTLRLDGCIDSVRNEESHEPSVRSSHLLKPCLCGSENCRKFLPVDKDIF